MRRRLTNYILHWKMMLFRGQGMVEFSGANYSADACGLAPGTAPYSNYTDEAIFFTSDPAIVNSFRDKFDDYWTNTTDWANYANISGALTRYAPDGTYAQDPSLNFPPDQNYRSRSVSRYSTAVRQRRPRRRRHHVPHHRPRPHRCDDQSGGARHPRAADHRAGAVPAGRSHVARVERRPALHGRRPDPRPPACRAESPEVASSSTIRTPLPATRRW